MESNGPTWSQNDSKKRAKGIQNGASKCQNGAKGIKSSPHSNQQKPKNNDGQKRSVQGCHPQFGGLGPDRFFFPGLILKNKIFWSKIRCPNSQKTNAKTGIETNYENHEKSCFLVM